VSVRRLSVSAGIAVAILLVGSTPALAAPSCTISTTSMAFGTYDVYSASAVTSTAQITYQCNGGASNVFITLSKGQSVTFAPRTMKAGTNVLSYNLYQNAAFSIIWGDGTGGSQSYITSGKTPNKTNFFVTIYGRVPAQQDASAGSYTDTVVATIDF
jgi:spore coat protein U-like protein